MGKRHQCGQRRQLWLKLSGGIRPVGDRAVVLREVFANNQRIWLPGTFSGTFSGTLLNLI